MNMLIVDDNIQTTSVLSDYAEKEGYHSIIARDGACAMDVFNNGTVDLVLLDTMIPLIGGFEVCRRIRNKSNVPIIMLSARGEDFEKIMGLDIGADDYILKPFSPAEVMARIRAVLRRMYVNTGNIHGSARSLSRVYKYRSLKINMDEYTASINGINLDLTKKEIELLWTLINNTGRVFTRDNLLGILWGYDYAGDVRTVDSHIARLRAKLSVLKHDGWDIKTIRGVGYKFERKQEQSEMLP